MLDNPIEEVFEGLTFTVEKSEFGVTVVGGGGRYEDGIEGGYNGDGGRRINKLRGLWRRRASLWFEKKR